MDNTNITRPLDMIRIRTSAGCIYPLAVLVFTGLLTSCAVGPDFQQPAAPETGAYTAAPQPIQTVSAATALGGPQRLIEGMAISGLWWHELGSPKLDALIDTALQASPTLASSQAASRQAYELYAALSGSTRYPQVDATLNTQRQLSNPSALGQVGDAQTFTLYNTSVGVHYQLDLAGGNRRALEALAARSDYWRYQLAGTHLTLAANIVTTAVTQARLTAQIQATETILSAQEEQLRLTRERVRLGQAAADEVLALQTQVEQTRAGVPLLRQQRQQNEHLLAVLVGRAPGAGNLPAFTLNDFTLPSDLPLVVPSELVRRRPDIQAAQALLQAANAEYGVTVARLYPQINLSATLGSEALTIGTLFGSGSAVWSLIGQLTQPLFNPGLPAEKRAALAAFDAAAANYQNIVLESLRNVADVLSALDNDAQTLAALATADAAAQGSVESMQRQYALGNANSIQLLTVQQQAQQNRINLIAAQAQRLVDSAALYQAMGGGWMAPPVKGIPES